MARSIHATVGKIGSANIAADVRTVQELLNNVPSYEGGPDPRLIVDGRCGPQLVAIIKEFQAGQFYRVVEDGKVNPGGQTITRLNQYTSRPALTGSSTMSCPHGGAVMAKALRIVPGLDPSEAPLMMTDHFQIAGCPLSPPCVKVKWLTSLQSGKVLDADCGGLCLTSANSPQGPVNITSV